MAEESAPVRIAIIDYEMGNLFSVRHACSQVGMEPIITSEARAILAADAAILPGVGAFGEAMANLRRLDLIAPIRDFISKGNPFMGICLGLQLLFEESEEFGRHSGLGLLKGVVRRFPDHSPKFSRVRVPQIGWNRIFAPEGGSGWEDGALHGLCQGEFMYFVHSYFVLPADKKYVLCTTEYEGINYCSGVRHENLFAVQFHPEKSAQEGIRIYRNFYGNILKQKGFPFDIIEPDREKLIQ